MILYYSVHSALCYVHSVALVQAAASMRSFDCFKDSPASRRPVERQLVRFKSTHPALMD